MMPILLLTSDYNMPMSQSVMHDAHSAYDFWYEHANIMISHA